MFTTGHRFFYDGSTRLLAVFILASSMRNISGFGRAIKHTHKPITWKELSFNLVTGTIAFL